MSALSIALNSLRSDHHSHLNPHSPTPPDTGYSNIRGSPPSRNNLSSRDSSIKRFVDIPKTTTDTLNSSSSISPPTNSYRLSTNRSLSPAGSITSVTSNNANPPITSPLITPASPTSTNAAQVLLQTSHGHAQIQVVGQSLGQSQQSHSSHESQPSSYPHQPSSLSRQLSSAARHEHHLISAKTSAIAAASPRNRRLSSTTHTPTGSYISKSSPGLPPVSSSASSSLLKSHLLQQTTPVGSPNSNGGPLNTNSPIAIAAAAAVTPDKLSRLLSTQGPLAIRHITSHLALTIPGFADLSLSKQRRLIIAVLDNGDPVNSIVFEKVGWGRWAARKTDSPAVAAATAAATATVNGSSKHRRDSITADLISSSINPPISPVLNAIDSHYISTSVKPSNTPYNDDIDLADDDMMFHNSVIRRPSHIIQGIIRSRRKRRPSQKMRERIAFGNNEIDDDDDEDDDLAHVGVRNTVFDESVFVDDDDLEDIDLDDQEAVDDAIHLNIRRPSRNGGGDTDDEDWQAMGAAKLRHTTLHKKPIQEDVIKREQEAIDALVQLKSI